MKHILLVFIAFIYCTQITVAQNQKTTDLTGIITDTLDNPLIAATVLLLQKSDSTMVSFTRTEMDGSFKLKDVNPGKYIVKSTYIGYLPLGTPVTVAGEKNINLGTLKMSEIASELMEVVIKAAKAPMVIRGDTIEYDASTFKVPEGSSVEELLKRLPGIEVDMDGSILSDGKNVSKVTVDGKNFFGSDPKAATKNLPAQGISKIQVFDTKTEQEEITGTVGASEDKTMNLELKEGFKNGGFGKVVVGYGTSDRAEIKGNYNKFNDKIQFSLVGVGNNTGRNGLGWNDYQDFLGSNSFSFNDDGEYGFDSGGGRMFIFGGGSGDDDIESSIRSAFFNGGDGGGFPRNYNGGINFNYDHKKTKFSSVYFYNYSALENAQDRKQISYFNDFSLFDLSNVENDDVSAGHRAELQFEQEFDSLHTMKLSMNGAYIDNQKLNNGEISLSKDDNLTNSTIYDNELNTNGYLYSGLLVFRKKFKKEGRSFGINTSYLNSHLDRFDLLNSLLSFYDDQGQIDSLQTINQENTSIQDKTQIKANAIYVEPISDKWFLQTFYNYSNRLESGDRNVLNIEENNKVLNEDLSRIYENNIIKNRVGTSIRYGHKGYNISLGVAYQVFALSGLFLGKGNSDLSGTVDNVYANWIPNVSISISPSRTIWSNLSYGLNASEPSINQLQPIVDNSNPLYIRTGNPNLEPRLSHSMNGYLSKSYPASGFRINGGGYMNLYINNIINEIVVDDNLITYSKPINYEGGYNVNFWSGMNIPLIKNKLKLNARYNYSISENVSLVNTIENNTTNYSQRPNLSVSYTPTKDIGIEANTNFTFSSVKYDLSSNLNEKNRQSNYSLQVNTKTFYGIFLNSSFNYSIYENERFNFNQSIPILNASIYKYFLKGNKLETRLSLYDAFNRNLAVSQFPTNNGFVESQTSSLGRYLMLSLAYNIRGMEAEIDKGGHHFF